MSSCHNHATIRTLAMVTLPLILLLPDCLDCFLRHQLDLYHSQLYHKIVSFQRKRRFYEMRSIKEKNHCSKVEWTTVKCMNECWQFLFQTGEMTNWSQLVLDVKYDWFGLAGGNDRFVTSTIVLIMSFLTDIKTIWQWQCDRLGQTNYWSTIFVVTNTFIDTRQL